MYIYIYIYILLIPTAIACMRVTGEWALLFWTTKKFGHVSACSGSVMIPSMGLHVHGQSYSLVKIEIGRASCRERVYDDV